MIVMIEFHHLIKEELNKLGEIIHDSKITDTVFMRVSSEEEIKSIRKIEGVLKVEKIDEK